MLSAAERREAAGENFGLRTSAGADPSSLSQLSQDKDHLRELLTFAVLTHFRKIRPGSVSTFANYGPGADPEKPDLKLSR